ncbi:ankyrin repeat-containing protein [Sporocytophaga myxococcoides]|uniref:Ankyrin repeat-containing protein n=1 Tax=Sporocytophaga myxococcoides TaxID=153721 RepID=A0A098LLA6_9BACT|nr:hypothetical protein [Sporocytophaga myxococcoides]GAL87746.1 ankyrin repeat-containing protein [Sporocytophaga myxococcoides]
MGSKKDSEKITLNSFRKEYIWGFTQGNPKRMSDDKNGFYKLIQPLTGNNGTITIGASFHPYQIINQSGDDIWETLYKVIEANKFCDYNHLIEEKYFFHMNTPGPQAFPIGNWEDQRLYTEINPEFSRFVPFLIPYLTYNTLEDPLWLEKLHMGIATVGNAQEFIESVNIASRFLMPEPTFFIGFGVFEKNNPSELIDHYVDFLERHLKK